MDNKGLTIKKITVLTAVVLATAICVTILIFTYIGVTFNISVSDWG